MNVHGGDIYSNNIEHDFSVNINPLGIHSELLRVMKDSVLDADKYPDLLYANLCNSISELENCEITEIVCGNGASELLMAVFKCFVHEKILIPVPSFTGYLHASGTKKVQYYYLTDNNNFELTYDFCDYLLSEECVDVDALVLADPNNPNGKRIDKDLLNEILSICNFKGITVVLDRCFGLLSDIKVSESIMLIREYPNTVIVNAFTKSMAIPGIRIGYCIANDVKINAIKKYLPEWNLSVIAQNAGIKSCEIISKTDYISDALQLIGQEKIFLLDALKRLCIRTFPTDTNYILLYSEKDLYNLCLKHKILIRDCSNVPGLGKGYYRIAIKQHEENLLLIETLSEINE